MHDGCHHMQAIYNRINVWEEEMKNIDFHVKHNVWKCDAK